MAQDRDTGDAMVEAEKKPRFDGYLVALPGLLAGIATSGQRPNLLWVPLALILGGVVGWCADRIRPVGDRPSHWTFFIGACIAMFGLVAGLLLGRAVFYVQGIG